MSYAQAMRWQKKHPRGGKPQYMGFSAGSGFWPSVSFTTEKLIPYMQACESIGVKPIKGEAFYNLTMRGRIMCQMNVENQAEYTRLMRLRATEEPNNGELSPFRT